MQRYKAAIVFATTVVMSLGAPVLRPRAPPPACDTVEEQQGDFCQLACNCSCGDSSTDDDDRLAQFVCTRVCSLPNGVSSVPWCTASTPPPMTNITVELNVTFMTAFGRAFSLDIYSDTTVDDDAPLALLIHGGGFVGGDKADMAVEAAAFAARGFRAVSINYPLCKDMFDHTTQALHPWNSTNPTDGNNSDCLGVASGTDNLPAEIRGSLAGPASRAARLAIQYMHTGGRATQYQVDTSKTVCHGASAGAITCYGTLFWNTTIIAYPNITNALVPDPVLDQYHINVAAARAGGIQPGNEHIVNVTQETVDAMAPGAAVWDLHGDNDTVVPLESSDNMMNIAETYGIPHQQVVIEGAGHGLFRYLNGSVLEGMFEFIFQNLDNVPANTE